LKSKSSLRRQNIKAQTLDRSSASSDQLQNQNYYGNHQQQMNQAATNAADETQQPQNQQYQQNCPKHFYLTVLS
jgi:hypothetical protein